MQLAIASLALTLAAAPLAAQSNVLVIVADDVGVDMVGAYQEGTQLPRTPRIDALAGEGVLFRNAWSPPICGASRASLLSGRHPFRNGVGNIGAMPLSEVTIAEVLKADPVTDWATAMFGKFHLGSPTVPNAQGFDQYQGWLNNLGPRPGETKTLDFWNYDEVTNGVTAYIQNQYAPIRKVDGALAWIGAQTKPWLCIVSFHLAHDPFHAPPPHLHSHGTLPPYIHGISDPRPYAEAMVEAMDTEIGRLLDGLGPARRETTHVFFVGDNGTPPEVVLPPITPDHAKLSPYEGGVNVPFIVAGPAVSGGGREVGTLVGMTDLFATIAELCGIDLASDPQLAGVALDSQSFAPWLADPLLAFGPAPQQRRYVFSERFKPSSAALGAEQSARRTVRNARYKLIRTIEHGLLQPEEFYDLWLDPFEETNLLGGALTSQESQHLSDLQAEMIQLLGS